MIFGDAVTPDGLTISITRVMTLDEWAEALEVVTGLSSASPWWIGDMLSAADHQYGESYAQAIPEGLSSATIRAYQWVAERVPPANRHPGLSWSHHRAVSALPTAEQTSLLDQAEAEGWTVRELQARGQAPKRKTSVYHAESYTLDSVTDGMVWMSFAFHPEDADEIGTRLQAGKRVTIET